MSGEPVPGCIHGRVGPCLQCGIGVTRTTAAEGAWPEALLAHLQRLTDAVERVEGRLEGLEAALVKRGSL